MNKFIIIAVLAFTIIGCSEDKRDKIVGTWEVERMYLDTNDVTQENMRGQQRWITFNEDGSLVSDQFNGTWDYNNEDNVLTLNNTDSEDSRFRWKVDFEKDKMVWQGTQAEEAERMKVHLVRTDQQFTRTEPAEQPTDGPVVRDTADLNIGKAIIDSVNIIVMRSMPVQVSVNVRGFLNDGCTTIHRVDRKKEGNSFIIDIFTERPKEAMCTQALVPFEQNVPLDVQGLAAGAYKVVVNGVEKSFDLSANN